MDPKETRLREELLAALTPRPVPGLAWPGRAVQGDLVPGSAPHQARQFTLGGTFPRQAF